MINCDRYVPLWLIGYSSLSVIIVVFAPSSTPESVKISVLVSAQTALGGAAGMSRSGKRDTDGVDNIENAEENAEDIPKDLM